MSDANSGNEKENAASFERFGGLVYGLGETLEHLSDDVTWAKNHLYNLNDESLQTLQTRCREADRLIGIIFKQARQLCQPEIKKYGDCYDLVSSAQDDFSTNVVWGKK